MARAGRLRHLARIIRAEANVTAAARRSLQVLLDASRRALEASGQDPAVLSDRLPGWRQAVTADLEPAVGRVFADAYSAIYRGATNPDPFVIVHLNTVRDRLVGAADGVFDSMRAQLAEGRAQGETIPQLAARIDTLLADEQRWKNRATTIARTEVVGANNAGARSAAGATADTLGVARGDVVKEWLGTSDGRTRETHAEVDGTQVLGLDATFNVGGYDLSEPGDQSGPPEEVVNCRCTVIFYYPGDPDYPTELATASSTPARYPGTPAGSTADAARAAAQAPTPEPATPDTGPQTDQDRLARGLTLDELAAESRSGTPSAKAAARAELTRRGLPPRIRASGMTTRPITEAEARSGEVDGTLVVVDLDGTVHSLDTFVGREEECTCCGGAGEHTCGHECYVCDAGMSREAQAEGGDGVEPGDPLVCAGHHGRPDPDQDRYGPDFTHDPDPVSPDAPPPGTPVRPEEAAVTTTPPETDPTQPVTPPTDPPTHAGVAVQAADTGRILMLQRSLDQDDAPEVRGTWEFPGGTIEEGETPEAAAWREFAEETGLAQPAGETTGTWYSPNGVYQGFVWTTPTELGAFGELNPDLAAAEVVNPDDPERRNPDVTAWWTLEQIDGMGPALRPEVRDTDWSQFMPTPTAMTDPDADQLQAALELARRAGYTVGLSQSAVSSRELAAAGEPPLVDLPAPPGTPATASDIATDGEPFYGIAAPEMTWSGDDRAFGAGSLTNRDLPLPLMYQDAQAERHNGAVRVGRLDVLELDTTGPAPMLRYAGVWDTSEIAIEARRQVEAKVARGVSVDCDAVTVELAGSDGQTLDPMVDEFPDDGIVRELATSARVCGLTICSVPAFHQAYIANGRLEDRTEPEPGQEEVTGSLAIAPPEQQPVEPVEDPLVASAATPERGAAWSLVASVEYAQPADAFTRPDVLDLHAAGTPLTVTEDGRVYGHLAVWGTCHIGIDGLCQEPPASASNYAHFASGTVPTDDGAYAVTGPLTIGTGHAAMNLGLRAAAAHYDNTGAVVADVAMGQDHIGIWYAGTVRPFATPEQVYALRAAGKVSGDWRESAGSLELVAALVVNVPGFSVPRPALAASGRRAHALVAAGMVQATHTRQEPAAETATVETVLAALDRRTRGAAAAARLTQARTRVRTHRVAAASARLARK